MNEWMNEQNIKQAIHHSNLEFLNILHVQTPWLLKSKMEQILVELLWKPQIHLFLIFAVDVQKDSKEDDESRPDVSMDEKWRKEIKMGGRKTENMK